MNYQRLKELLSYDPATGVFRWRVKPSRAVSIDDIAGSVDRTNGYRRIALDGKKNYKAHRLAWLYVTGEWPQGDLDHINLDKDDNRIANLREATGSQNCANQKAKRNGLKGAYRLGQRWWQAVIVKHGKRFYLGCFATELEAHNVYSEAAKKVHGEFARAN